MKSSTRRVNNVQQVRFRCLYGDITYTDFPAIPSPKCEFMIGKVEQSNHAQWDWGEMEGAWPQFLWILKHCFNMLKVARSRDRLISTVDFFDAVLGYVR